MTVLLLQWPQDPSEGVDSARAFFRNTWNAQRSSQPSQRQQSFTARADTAKQAPQASEAQRPGYPPQRSQTPSAGGNPKAAHGLQAANGVPNGWQSMQAVQVLVLLTCCTSKDLCFQPWQRMQIRLSFVRSERDHCSDPYRDATDSYSVFGK